MKKSTKIATLIGAVLGAYLAALSLGGELTLAQAVSRIIFTVLAYGAGLLAVSAFRAWRAFSGSRAGR